MLIRVKELTARTQKATEALADITGSIEEIEARACAMAEILEFSLKAMYAVTVRVPGVDSIMPIRSLFTIGAMMETLQVVYDNLDERDQQERGKLIGERMAVLRQTVKEADEMVIDTDILGLTIPETF